MKIRPWLATWWLLACGDDDPSPERLLDASVEASVPLDASMRPDASAEGPLGWESCGDAGLQCATMIAPSQLGTQNIALMRRPASGARLGSLVWNPGGPGSSAIDYLPDLVIYLRRSAVLERYDLVAMDPRGVGHSDPIVCHGKLQKLYAQDPNPDDEQDWAAIDEVAKQFADECASKYPAERLGELRTIHVAEDLELLRKRLGEDKLNFLGLSYGTAIGAHYAAKYPDKVGRFVLDGPVDLALDPFALTLQQAKGFENALQRYFAWCNAERCAWAKGVEPAQAFAALLAQVEQKPLPSPDWDRPCGPGEVLQGVIAFLYAGEPGWEVVSDDLRLAVAGDGSGLVASTDIYLDRDLDTGKYSNISEANFAVNCADDAPITMAQLRAQEASFRAAAPFFGVPILTHLAVCTHWAVKGEKAPLPANLTSPPFVVLGTTQDPATPYAWAQATAARLGPSARLFTYEGEGHTAYARDIACVNAAVDDYLLDGVLPAEGARCADNVALRVGRGTLRKAALIRR